MFLIVTLLVVSAVSKAVMDKLQFHYHGSVFAKFGTWWNPETSWKNKWRNGDPRQGEKFPGSSTVFVAFTDSWHCAQLLHLSAWQLALAVSVCDGWHVLVAFLLIKCGFSALFELTFRILGNK